MCRSKLLLCGGRTVACRLSSSISAWYLFHGFGHDEQLQALSLLAKMKGDPWTTFSACFLGVCSMLLVDICITVHLTLTVCVYLPLLLFRDFFLINFFNALLSNALRLVEASMGRCCSAFKSCWFGFWHCLNQFYRVLPSVRGAVSKVLFRSSKLV